uniref:Uncharacterized protein n=1 Tax=Ciona savignyi TaxID=51511 RepID=H2YPW6_CIOSA
MKKDKLCLVETGGSSIVRYKSIFSNDSKYLLCPCGNVIKVYSTTTGQCWQKLLGHTDNVTKVDYHPSIKLQVISSSLDSTIRLWDYEDGVMLSSIHFNAPLLGVFSCKLFPKIAFLVRKTAEGNELCRFHLDFSGSSNTTNNSSDVIMKSMDRLTEKEIAFSKNFFVVSRKKSLQVFSNLNTVKRKDGIRHYLKAEDSLITCVACHPDLEQCVTG